MFKRREISRYVQVRWGAVADFGRSQRSAIPGGRGLRFHHNFVDSLTVRENFSVKFILMRKSVRAFVGELGCR